MSPVILGILVIPVILGILVILRMVWTGVKLLRTRSSPDQNRSRKLSGPVIPLLDQPFPCPSCGRQDLVMVARSDFREMPYVEHFNCHACGTQFLGPNQEKMVEKRLEARKKFHGILAGAPKPPETKS